ncbi:MAG TPA: beta-propeller fold lactonase family protein [Allosphingosinicella sp.]|nr:beta-propeller fold lactonase family protein [Allosphingosinicella sp.]
MTLSIVLAGLAALGWSGDGQTAPAPAAAPAAGTLLVGNKGENTISFIDLAAGRELGRAPTGPMPHEIAISPDGTQAAVVAYGGRTIDIFDVATRAKVRTIDLSPNEGPHGIAWLGDGRILVTTERSRSLTIVDTRRGDSVSAIATDQGGTHMVAVSPDARHAFTANMESGSIGVIDLAAGRLIRNFSVGGTPEGMALTPNGRTLWVADRDGDRVQAFEVAALTAVDESRYTPMARIDFTLAEGSRDEVESAILRPLLRQLARPGLARTLHGAEAGRGWIVAMYERGADLADIRARLGQAVQEAGAGFPAGRTEVELRFASSAPAAEVVTGDVPIRVAASPDGRWIVTSNFGGGSLTLVDARARRAARQIEVSGERSAEQVTILFSADGRRIYAAETGRDRIAEVDLESGRVLRRLESGRQGDGLAVAPAVAPQER